MNHKKRLFPHTWRFIPLVAAALCLMLAACSSTGTRDLLRGIPATGTRDLMRGIPATTTHSNTSASTSARASVARAVADFSWKLFQAELERDGNVMISPLSVHIALSMTMNGARGETLEQMRQVLGTSELSQELLNQGVSDWLNTLDAKDAAANWQVANSVWVHEDYLVDNAFLGALKSFYRADARALDFQDPKTVPAINGWVKDKTNGKIEQIIDQIGRDVRMYLINAVWFKADWQSPFKASATQSAEFSGAEGTVQAQFMNQSATMDMVEGAWGEGIVLPYTDPRFVFVALLPKEGTTPRQLANDLDMAGLVSLLASRTSEQADLALPRFESSDETELSMTLSGLGMEQAFSAETADFSGMSAEGARDLYISKVRHKTYIRVDEEGTEAAAVTSVEMAATSMPMPARAMRFDRPFLYAVVDVESGMPLFLGVMENPR